MSVIFLDACVIIYRIEAAAPFAERLREAFAELQASDPGARVAVSDLSRLECQVQPLRAGRRDLVAAYDGFFAAAGLIVVPLSAAVIDLATAIRARSLLRTPDALQAACCLGLGQPARFVTNDAGFRREAALDVVLI